MIFRRRQRRLYPVRMAQGFKTVAISNKVLRKEGRIDEIACIFIKKSRIQGPASTNHRIICATKSLPMPWYCQQLWHGRLFGKIFQCFCYVPKHFFATLDPMPLFQIFGVIIAEPHLAGIIMPDKCFLGKIDCGTLSTLHQRRSHFRVTENDELGGA